MSESRYMKSKLEKIQYKCYVAAKTCGRYGLPIAIAAVPGIAMAGSGGGGDQDFFDIWEKLEGWITGTLGHVIALTMVIVGIVYGIGRQNIMAFVMGPAAGIGLYNAPTIIQTVMGAGLSF